MLFFFFFSYRKRGGGRLGRKKRRRNGWRIRESKGEKKAGEQAGKWARRDKWKKGRYKRKRKTKGKKNKSEGWRGEKRKRGERGRKERKKERRKASNNERRKEKERSKAEIFLRIFLGRYTQVCLMCRHNLKWPSANVLVHKPRKIHHFKCLGKIIMLSLVSVEHL